MEKHLHSSLCIGTTVSVGENRDNLGYNAASSGNFIMDVSGQPIGPIFKGSALCLRRSGTNNLSLCISRTD